jgi:hypothetical protein
MSHIRCELGPLCRTHHYGEELVLRRRAVVSDGRQRRRRNLVIRIACAFRRSTTTPTVYCGGTPCSRGGQAGSSGATYLPVLLLGAALARHSTQRSSEYCRQATTAQCSRGSAEGPRDCMGQCNALKTTAKGLAKPQCCVHSQCATCHVLQRVSSACRCCRSMRGFSLQATHAVQLCPRVRSCNGGSPYSLQRTERTAIADSARLQSCA